MSGGVLPSAPGQKGQFLGPVTRTLSRRKSEGRFPRSVEMMTQRPVMGSLRNSGKASLLEFKSQETDALRMALCLRLYRVWSRVLQLGAEGVFVEADGGGMARVVVDGEDVEAAGANRNGGVGEGGLPGAGPH